MRRGSAALYVLLAMYAAVSLGYYVAGALALREEFFHAPQYTREPFEVTDDAQAIEQLRKEATAAGLAKDDVLLAINGTPWHEYAQVHDLFRHSRPGTAVDVVVRKPSGEVRTAHVGLGTLEGPGWDLGRMAAFLLPVCGVPLVSLLVGYWVVAARPRDLNAWTALVLLTFPEAAFGNLDAYFWPAPWYIVLPLWNALIGTFAFSALLWFGFLFPDRWRLDVRLPWIKYLVLALAAVHYAINLTIMYGQYFAPGMIRGSLPFQVRNHRIDGWVQAAAVILFLSAMFDKLRSSKTADMRRRVRVLAIGSALSLGPLLLIFGLAPLFGVDPHHGQWFITVVPLLVLFPLTLAYVLIVQRAMDVRILLRMGTKYLLARATLLLLEMAVVGFVLLRFVLPWMRGGEHQTLKFVLLAVCLAVLFQAFTRRNSLGERLQRSLDRRFFREAYNSEVVLSELSHQVRQLTDPADVIHTVLRRLAEVLHVSEMAVLLRGSNVFHLEGAMGLSLPGPVALPESSATVQHLLRTSEPATLYRDRPEPWFDEAGTEEKSLLREMNAELLLPMPGRERLVGVLALGPKRSEEPYTPTDLRTLQSVAAQTGLTLEVTELAQRLAGEAAQRERMNREIEIAREVQERLFPQSVPAIEGVSLAGFCRPALEVGGDYYDLVEMEGGRLGIAIGDVSGKGISAALIMASLRASLRGLILDIAGDCADDLSRLMGKVNQLVYEASSSSRYATFFFATYDPATQELLYVNAGHNPPVVVRRGSGEQIRLEACGPVVGLLPGAPYETRAVKLQFGDTLLAYTDGISEAMTGDDEEWGEERMLAAMAATGQAQAEAILGELFRAADDFTAGAKQHDDMTLLVMRLCEESGGSTTAAGLMERAQVGGDAAPSVNERDGADRRK